MDKNPYTLLFGKEPTELISRSQQEEEIIANFTQENPSEQIYMITGVRGSGKTVLMTSIVNKLKTNKDWICVELNPDRDLLTSLASKLSSNNELALIFKDAKINLSFFGLGIEIKNIVPITDIETAITKMLESIKKHGKKVLITIDEVINTQYVREFSSAFQIFVRQDLPLFLIMTGLYENIYELQNEKTLTFLYRAPKIKLTSLNIGAIANNYQMNFKIDDETALKMARLTKGYSFAFQVLGHLTYKYNGDYAKTIPEYRQYLEEYVYEKMWSELSKTDKKVMYAIASTNSTNIIDIRQKCNMTTNQFNPYRKRLIQKGLIDGSEHGQVVFTLPLFKEFVLSIYEE